MAEKKFQKNGMIEIKYALGLFDGMSCGQIALNRSGIKYDKYYASEIDKHAIKVTQFNYPDTIQLGSIENWIEWDIDWKSIGIIMAGSPCQGFSFAGKKLEFDDPRSKLFFVFIDILNHIKSINPNVLFLLENVRMAKEHEAVITQYTGVNPIVINSALVSAQNRYRNYWTNIGLVETGLFGDLMPSIPQPEDKGILLKHILEKEVDEKYYLSEKMLNYLNTRTKVFNNGEINLLNGKDKSTSITGNSSIDYGSPLKASCFTAGGHSGGLHSQMDLIKCLNLFNQDGTQTLQQDSVFDPEGKMTAISSELGGRFNIQEKKDYIQLDNNNGESHNSQGDRLYFTDNKAPSLGSGYGMSQPNIIEDKEIVVHNMSPRSGDPRSGGTGHLSRNDGKTYCLQTSDVNRIEKDFRIRRLTPIEVERLQTVSDNYTSCVSDTQRYRMLGNGWTIDVIVHILSFI